MPKSKDENPLKDQLEDIRRRLVGDLTIEDLQEMQLQMDVLERWARIAQEGDHHHNHMDDHDHTSKFIEPYVVLARPERAAAQLAQRTSKSRSR